MKHLKRINEMQDDNKFTVSAKDMQIFADNEKNPKYPELSYESETSKGDFDSEKGAMCDYPIYLYNKQTKETWEGFGGYYTGPTGECHNGSIEFEKQIPKEKTNTINLTDKELTVLKRILSSDLFDYLTGNEIDVWRQITKKLYSK